MHYPAQAGPKTTTVVAQRTTAKTRPTARSLQLPTVAAPAPALRRPRAVALQRIGPTHALSALQTAVATRLQLQTVAARARSPARPTTSAHLTRKSFLLYR